MWNSKNVRRLVLSCLIALAGAGLVACGPDTGNNGGGSLTPAETEDRIEELFGNSICTNLYECPEEQDPNTVAFASRYETKEACSENILAAFGAGGSTLERDVEAGLTEFDGEKARECLDAFESQLTADACTGVFSAGFDEPEACDQAVQGTQPNGAACDSDEHCQSGYCDTDVMTPENACWGGNCAEAPDLAPLGPGESCTGTDADCDDSQNLVCDLSSDSQDFVCVEIDSRAEGETCSASSVCESGLSCLDNTCTTLQLGAAGDACDAQTTFCQPGLVCAVESITAAGLEGSCSTPLAQGADCYLDVSCKDGFQCQGASFENQTPGTCELPLGEGEACDSDFDCQEGLTCGFEDTCEVEEEEPYCDPTEMTGS